MHTPSAHGDAQYLLGLYLNDHLAGSTAGVDLLNRAANNHHGSPFGPPLERLAREVAQDRESLKDIMRTLDVPERRSRAALGWLGEKAGRLKLNGRLFSRSPLSDVLELEAMRMGVQGKRSCWLTLHTLAASDRRLDAARLAGLLARAEEQSDVLEELRTRCAVRAFAAGHAGAARTARAKPRPRGAF
ncbi:MULTISPECIES: hypothetical protein [unclassified Streptomyces]|uniref:hypothetical protein n=1 Tax=unclassified Streptomyces TaxID=2593676 RepID=UPI002E153863|nr:MULTISPECIES: hypothetical protein [unclassified Streptomyces]WSR24107.1 hypothetical protein OG573_36925 [Streptomyces sp. NBC_01205]